jgi:hypothetical protein
MKFRTHNLLAWPLLAIVLGACAPMYAGTIVAGQVGQNSAGTATNLLTMQQTGSGVSDTLPWSFICTTCSGYGITASGTATVDNGTLRATATIGVTGAPGSPFLADANSTADYSDMLTITGGGGTNGTSGVLELTYALDGVISSVGSGLDGLSNLEFFMNPATSSQFDNEGIESGSDIQVGLDGTYHDTVIFYIPFTYGTPFATEVNLSASPGFVSGFFSGNDVTPYTSTVNYYDTASLNSALVFGGTIAAIGAQNTSAAISSASGLGFGPNGNSTAAPEPGTWFLAVLGMGFLGWAKRKKSGECGGEQ